VGYLDAGGVAGGECLAVTDPMKNELEVWVKIPSFPMYSVSSLGNVRRDVHVYGHAKGAVLHPGISNGYPHVMLTDGKRIHGRPVHRVATEAFLGQRENGMFVNHKDGNKKNNAKNNLEYVTPSENNLHASRIGLLPKGEKHGMAKLTNEKVKTMRWLRSCGGTWVGIGRKFGVSYVCAREAIKGRTWAHVK